MRTPHQPNPNPAVEAIMQAYLKTHMSEAQFEALIVKTLEEAKAEGNAGTVQQAYDRGFSDGYDTAVKER